MNKVTGFVELSELKFSSFVVFNQSIIILNSYRIASAQNDPFESIQTVNEVTSDDTLSAYFILLQLSMWIVIS